MSTPDTTPAPTPVDTTAATDQVLAGQCQTLGDHLAGLIAAGMLDTVGQPGKLPELLYPDGDPDVVREVAARYLAVGYRAGKLAGRPEWTVAGLNRLKATLHEAGYRSMGRLTERTGEDLAPAVAPHPTDVDYSTDGVEW